jgi:hypothetical protein
MSSITAALNSAFLAPFNGAVVHHGPLERKPLIIDLAQPNPPRLRLYMYSLVGGKGERSRREYKVVLRAPGQPTGVYRGFDHSDGRFTLVVGYAPDLDVFVLWDASLHPRFKSGGNLQVRDDVVRRASAVGVAEQVRLLTSGAREVVLACQSPTLQRAIDARIASTGGLREDEWATFLS